MTRCLSVSCYPKLASGATRGNADTQTLALLIAAQNATRGPQWWYMSVLILIMVVPVVAMAVALERYIRRGMLIGAVKG
jgi:multiple sugar transport system permease protein